MKNLFFKKGRKLRKSMVGTVRAKAVEFVLTNRGSRGDFSLKGKTWKRKGAVGNVAR
jgi:hypothetical protein